MADEKPPAASLRAALLVAVLAVVPYLNTLAADWVYDDAVVIRDNPHVIGPDASLTNTLLRPFPLVGLYRPVTMASYRLNALVASEPWAFHAVNVVVHALVSLAVLVLGVRVFRSSPAGLVAASLFAVHPIHTEAVSNIAGRSEPLSALFSLFCVLLCVDRTGPGRNSAVRLAAAAIALALAVGSKEGALVVPGLLAALWIAPHLRPRLRRDAASTLVVLCSVLLCFLLVRWFVVGSLMPEKVSYLSNPLAHVPTADRLRTAIVIAMQYVGLLFVPYPLAADYSPAQIPIVTSTLDPALIVALASFATIAALLADAGRRTPELAVAAGWFFLPLALTGNFLFPIVTNKAERILYAPSIGWCLLIGGLLTRLISSRRLAAILSVLMVAVFATLTHFRNLDWQSDFALWSSAVEAVPRASRAHYNLALALERQGRIDAALAHYGNALELHRGYDRAASAIGTIYLERGQIDRAEQWFSRSLAIEPENYNAHFNLGVLRHERGEPLAASAELWAAHWSDPAQSEPLPSLAVLAWMEGRDQDADRLVKRAATSRNLPDGARRVLSRLEQQVELGRRPEF